MENNSMNYGQLINAIELQGLNDATPPVSGTQDYIINGQLIATLAIPTWENERGILWNELWVNQPNYGTIQAQTNSSPQTWSLPPDFKFIGDGFVWVTYASSTNTQPQTTSWPVKMLPEMSLNELQNKREFYVSGNAVQGFTLMTGWIPVTGDSEIGANISFRYYKHANIPSFDANGNLTDITDYPEMSDPSYIIYKCAAHINAVNYNLQMYQIFEDKANYSLLQMRAANDMASNFMDDYVKDIDGLVGYGRKIPNRYNSAYWSYGSGGY